MMFWIFVSTITLATLLALYYAVQGGKVNASATANRDATLPLLKAQLSEIDVDIAQERLSPEQGEAAKAELARETMRIEQTADGHTPVDTKPSRYVFASAIVAIFIVSVGTYTYLGNPELPSEPAASREQPQSADMSVDQAVAQVEATLAKNPSDVRGWAVLGPIYMRNQRFAEAVAAFRQVLALAPATADVETDLAEALMMFNQGVAEGEPIQLLLSAAARDPNHVRSRFYLAGEATRAADFEVAVSRWQELLALSVGDEAWIAPARDGLATAEAGLSGNAPPQASIPTSDAIAGMVDGLSQRLATDGGTIEEWTRLVRSRLVLGELDRAQIAYDAAKEAFPNEQERGQLEALAQQAGMK